MTARKSDVEPRKTRVVAASVLALLLAALTAVGGDATPGRDGDGTTGMVKCGNLIYARTKTSVCFSDGFLAQVPKDTNINTHPRFQPVKLASQEIYEYPFAVMTGQGGFTLTEPERKNLRNYLLNGGFIVASAGCSSKPWNQSLQGELGRIFPDIRLKKLDADHPVFHTVHDISSSLYKRGGPRLPHLEGLEVDGKIVLIWSPDGLNESKNAGPKCCCCGGNEIKSAKIININLLAYALTH